MSSSPSSNNNGAQFRAISRNNSDFSSTISTTNSVASSRSQLAKLVDQRSSPIRSFQRATISSVVKTRAFDNNQELKELLATTAPSGQNSPSSSLHSTPVFSRSRSLRMSGGSQRYQLSPSYYRHKSRTPELHSFNSGDISSSYSNESQAKLIELNNEKKELKESLEFLECERQVLIDSTQDLKETLLTEKSQWKRELDDTKKQLTELIAAKLKAESQMTKHELEINCVQLQNTKLKEDLIIKCRELDTLKKEAEESAAINNELKRMVAEKLKYNGLKSNHVNEMNDQQVNECVSIVTQLAKLRLELNERDKIIERLCGTPKAHSLPETRSDLNNTSPDMENLNKFLDHTVECIKSWPDELAGSSHVQNLMKTLLTAHKVDQDDLCMKLNNVKI